MKPKILGTFLHRVLLVDNPSAKKNPKQPPRGDRLKCKEVSLSPIKMGHIKQEASAELMHKQMATEVDF